MANVFDQFDGPKVNPFDQFDAPPAETTGGYGQQIYSGLLEGATGALGFPVDAVNNYLVAPALWGVNKAFGTNLQPSPEPWGGSAGLRRGLAIAPESENRGEQFARRVGQSVGGSAVPMAATARTAGQAAGGLAAGLGGGVGGATAQQVFPGNLTAEIAGEMLGGLGTGGVVAAAANRRAMQEAAAGVPSVPELRDQASELYRAAEARGVVAGPGDTQALAGRVRQIARANELITPTGRVSASYPRAAEGMNLLDDYSGHEMNPTQMQVIRDTLADARNSTDGKERRIASSMLREFDDFVDPLAPELRQARGVSQRAFKGEQLETMRELAEANRPKFGASGVENALRQEYRSLDRRIVKDQEGGWSPAEIDAIQTVNRGTSLANIAQRLGKFAPTGIVSFMGAGGVPFVVGNAIGGPAVGAAASAATMGAGFVGREAATRMGMRNAALAELLARNGGPVQPVPTSELRRRIFEAIMGGQAAIGATP